MKSLKWYEDDGEWSTASRWHNDGDPFWYRLRRKGNRWWLDASDGELIGHLPRRRLGPYPSLEAAQLACEQIERESTP